MNESNSLSHTRYEHRSLEHRHKPGELKNTAVRNANFRTAVYIIRRTVLSCLQMNERLILWVCACADRAAAIPDTPPFEILQKM